MAKSLWAPRGVSTECGTTELFRRARAEPNIKIGGGGVDDKHQVPERCACLPALVANVLPALALAPPRCSERVVRGGPRFPARFGSRVRVPCEFTSGPQ